MDNKEILLGGRIGKIFKSDGNVIRPSNPWTRDVHDFLNFIISEGADFVPKPFGINENGDEILSFLPGHVFNYPLPDSLLSDSMIKCTAKLLLKYHKYSQGYTLKLKGVENWMLPPVKPIEVMCHGDFAPYNVTIINDQAVGIIDFDTLHPGPAIWDIAYAIYRWIPFTSPQNPDHYNNLDEQIRRAKLFLDSYGVDLSQRESLTQVLIDRLQSLVNFMYTEAQKGNVDFEQNIMDRHHQLYLDDIRYIKENEKSIKYGIQF